LDFISTVHAADPAPAAPAGAAPGPSLASFLPLIIIFVIFYFLLIRPQSKRAKEHKAMVAALAKGDEVVVNGMLGRVASLDDSILTVEIAKGVEVRVQRHAVTQVLPKGTVK
jgi:preprotein translocase subunit YajC